MPHLVKLYIRNAALGFVAAAVFVGLIMGLNVGNLWYLVTHVTGGWIAVLMLWLFNGIVFAGVQFALALPKGHGEEADDDGSGAAEAVELAEPIPAFVPVHPQRRVR